MLDIIILFSLFIEDCMFITSIVENSEGYLGLVVIGHTNGFKEPRLLVLVGHPYHSPPLALCANKNPNGFLYPMPNPPTQPCCTLHQQFPLLPNAHILQHAFPHFHE